MYRYVQQKHVTLWVFFFSFFLSLCKCVIYTNNFIKFNTLNKKKRAGKERRGRGGGEGKECAHVYTHSHAHNHSSSQKIKANVLDYTFPGHRVKGRPPRLPHPTPPSITPPSEVCCTFLMSALSVCVCVCVYEKDAHGAYRSLQLHHQLSVPGAAV